MRRPEGRTLYAKFCKLFTQISQTGPSSLKGKRRLTDGDISLLKGVELYKHTALNKWMRATPRVELTPDGQVEVRFSKQATHTLFSTPENTKGIALNVWCAAIDFERKEYQHVQSAELVFQAERKVFPKSRLGFSLHPVEDRVIVVALQLHLILENNQGYVFEGYDRRYTAGQLLDVGYVKNGELVRFSPEEVQQPNSPSRNALQQGVAWVIED